MILIQRDNLVQRLNYMLNAKKRKKKEKKKIKVYNYFSELLTNFALRPNSLSRNEM